MDNELHTLEGVVEEIIYVNEENGYTVMDFICKENLITVVGTLPFIYEGEELKVTGRYIYHQEYGEQFKAESFEKCIPKTVDAVMAFLSSGIIRGVRAATAAKIVEAFGKNSLEVIAEEPERLSELSGISKKRAYEISTSYREKKNVTDIIIFLQKYGISVNLAMKINKVLGNSPIEKIEENPYVLCDNIDGISFATADRIAGEMQITQNDKRRIKSGIRYALMTAALNGHTYLPYDELVKYAVKLLGVGEAEVSNVLVNLSIDSNVCVESHPDGARYFLPNLFMAEVNIARKLGLISRDGGKEKFSEKIFDEVEEGCDIILSSQQRQALKACVENCITVITGGPGTGKTTVIKSIIYAMERKGYKVTLTAPTGRAAKRISEVCNKDAATIHRLLEVSFSTGGKDRFLKNEQNPINTDVIIIDEMSMVDAELFSALLNAIRSGTKLVLVGDINQLPSVGAGDVLKDIIASGVYECVYLKEIFRQAEESLIVSNAHEILKGNYPENSRGKGDFFIIKRNNSEDVMNETVSLLKTRLPAYLNTKSKTAIQVLAPMKKTYLGTLNFNQVLQSELNPPSKSKREKQVGKFTFREGDRVIQMKNNYDIEWQDKAGNEGSGIFNGDTGIITSIDRIDGTVTVSFYDGKTACYTREYLEDLTLSYAITVHKSQGCEFDAVVLPLLYGPENLLFRNLLYTAVTRAKSLVVIVGSEECVKKMIENNRETVRLTTLKERIEILDC